MSGKTKPNVDDHAEKVERAANLAAADERAKTQQQLREEEDARTVARLVHLGHIAEGQCATCVCYGHERYQG